MTTVKGKIGLNDVSATTFKDILGYDLSYNSNYDGLSRILEQVSHAYVWRLNQGAKMANAYFADTSSDKEYNPDAESFEDITKIEPAPLLAIAHKDVGDWETAAIKFTPTDNVDTLVNENATAGIPQIINLEDINTTEVKKFSVVVYSTTVLIIQSLVSLKRTSMTFGKYIVLLMEKS